ncbi:MAG: cell division protein FtsZ [Alphaproteobacteria bacterium GM202ARS2]|nr:cell division protein FtsZ [Alphaproteobacteria bacterium GM202ARS2]
MALKLDIPVTDVVFKPRICVMGIGGGGSNAVNRMQQVGLEGAELVVANTDAQALSTSAVRSRVQLGPVLTGGLGAGSDASIGRLAAEEVDDVINNRIDGTNMLFIAAGLGGGTGSGAAPVIARLAKEKGILTVAVVTMPFAMEGHKKQERAQLALTELEGLVDTLIVVSNEKLMQVHGTMGVPRALQEADNVLMHGVRSIVDLMVKPGHINLDFADIQSVMRQMGKARIGSGDASGVDRAIVAAKAAITNPLLQEESVEGASDVLVNITCSDSVGLSEINDAITYIREVVNMNANVHLGLSEEPSLQEHMRVSVLIAGSAQTADRRSLPTDKQQEEETDSEQETHEDNNAETQETVASSRTPRRIGRLRTFWRWLWYGNGHGNQNEQEVEMPTQESEDKSSVEAQLPAQKKVERPKQSPTVHHDTRTDTHADTTYHDRFVKSVDGSASVTAPSLFDGITDSNDRQKTPREAPHQAPHQASVHRLDTHARYTEKKQDEARDKPDHKPSPPPESNQSEPKDESTQDDKRETLPQFLQDKG